MNCKKKKTTRKNNTTYIIDIGISLDRISKLQYGKSTNNGRSVYITKQKEI